MSDDDYQPRLGYATTKQLIDELAARADVSATIGESWPSYSTVTGHAVTKLIDELAATKYPLDLENSADSLRQAIHLAIGAASMTWPEVGGVFDSDKALDIAEQLEHEVIRRLSGPTDDHGCGVPGCERKPEIR